MTVYCKCVQASQDEISRDLGFRVVSPLEPLKLRGVSLCIHCLQDASASASQAAELQAQCDSLAAQLGDANESVKESGITLSQERSALHEVRQQLQQVQVTPC
jgi:hypothetical protein